MARVGRCSWFPLIKQSSYRPGMDAREIHEFQLFTKRYGPKIVVEVEPMCGNTDQFEYRDGSRTKILSFDYGLADNGYPSR